MVRIQIIAVGEDKDDWVSDGIAHFEKLLKRYAHIKWTIIKSTPKSAAPAPEQIKFQEAQAIRKHFNSGTIIALADSGRKYDSIKFAQEIEKILAHSSGEIKLIVGGPYGLDTSILESAEKIISLSSLTFSHQVVRLVLLEQLYRAFSILHGSDYHK